MFKSTGFLFLLLSLTIGYGANNALAQESNGIFIPLIGITSVPKPLALPGGPGDVVYKYAVKNFLSEAPLTNVQVTDDKCGTVKFVEGDDNKNNALDYSETWRYSCTTKLSVTTNSIATATGNAFGLEATHKAYATVVVGTDKVAPLVSIVNITKVSYPLSLPIGGGDLTFTYRVNNPGDVALSNVSVADDKCSAMSQKLGDTNGNNLLDLTEVWVYTCTTHITKTTTNTVEVVSYANGLKAVGYATLTVRVETPAGTENPNLPNTGSGDTETNPASRNTAWAILAAVLVVLAGLFVVLRKKKRL